MQILTFWILFFRALTLRAKDCVSKWNCPLERMSTGQHQTDFPHLDLSWIGRPQASGGIVYDFHAVVEHYGSAQIDCLLLAPTGGSLVPYQRYKCRAEEMKEAIAYMLCYFAKNFV